MIKLYYIIISPVILLFCCCTPQYYRYYHFEFADKPNKIGYAFMESQNGNYKILIRDIDTETDDKKQAILDYIWKKKNSPELEIIETPFKLSDFSGIGEYLFNSFGTLFIYKDRVWKEVEMSNVGAGITSIIVFQDKNEEKHIPSILGGKGVVDCIIKDDNRLILGEILSTNDDKKNVDIFEKMGRIIYSRWFLDKNHIQLEIRLFNKENWGEPQIYQMDRSLFNDEFYWNWDIDPIQNIIYILISDNDKISIYNLKGKDINKLYSFPAIDYKICDFWFTSNDEFIIIVCETSKEFKFNPCNKIYSISLNGINEIMNEEYRFYSCGKFRFGYNKGNFVHGKNINIMKIKP